MADIVKRVRTEYTTTGLLLGAGKLRKMRGEATKTAGVVGLLQNKLRGLASFGRSMLMGGGLLGGLGIAGAVTGLLKIGAAAEDTELALAGLIQKSSQMFNGTASTFERAHGAAKGLRKEFRELAERSPVTSGAIAKSFQDSTMVLSRFGIGLKKQAELSRSFALADLQNRGSPAGTAARDSAQLLRGQFSERMISTPALAGSIGKAIAKAAKKGDVKQAIGLLNKALTPSPKLLDAYQKSLTGLWATTKDQLGVLAESAAKPLLEFASEKLKEWNKWLKENRDLARKYARTIGRGIVSGLRAVVRTVKFVADHWDTIVTAAKVLSTIWIARLVFQMTTLVGKAAMFAKNLAAAAGINFGGKMGKMMAAGGGFIIGEGIGQGINAAADTGVQTSVFGVLADLFTGGEAGGITFGTTREQARKNAKIRADLRQMRMKSLEKQGKTLDAFGNVVDKKDMNESPDVSFGGGAPSKDDQKVGKMKVDKLEVRGEEMVRAMAPLTREISNALKKERPRASLFGMGSLTVANGVD